MASSMKLLGLSDPVRPTVAAAIQESYAPGIRVVMITGDSPGTAQTIARQIELMQMWLHSVPSNLRGMAHRGNNRNISSNPLERRSKELL